MEGLWRTIPQFPHFKDLSLQDRSLFDVLFDQFPPSISEFTFTNLFIWRHAYQIRISRLQNFLCLLSDNREDSFFFPPIGEGDKVDCYQRLLQYLKEKGVYPKISRVPESVVNQIDWNATDMIAQLDRDQCDYLYLTEDLIKLEGRKYHRKRNHIKQFKERYSYQYVSLTPEWTSACLQLETEWCDLRHCEVIPGLANESQAIKDALTHLGQLKARGGTIVIDGKVEAFTLGEPLNRETVVIHVEKANPAFEGLYPLINQSFLENEWAGYAYVNREQDLGEEGLRKAKESYFPHHLINKYAIILK
jgi:hypothetical protein